MKREEMIEQIQDEISKNYITTQKELKGDFKMICDECGEYWSDSELDSYSWHCLKCGHKIGD